MKQYLIALTGATFLAFTSFANAAFYDFTAEGNRDEQGYATFVSGVTNSNPMALGLTITASSTVDDQDPFPIGEDDDQAFVYMDGTLQADIDLFALGATNNLTLLALSSAATSISYEITGIGAQIYLSSLTTEFITTSTVPVPAAAWLFGTALIGFVGMSRRRKIA